MSSASLRFVTWTSSTLVAAGICTDSHACGSEVLAQSEATSLSMALDAGKEGWKVEERVALRRLTAVGIIGKGGRGGGCWGAGGEDGEGGGSGEGGERGGPGGDGG